MTDAAPIFHDRYLCGNGRPCADCDGTGLQWAPGWPERPSRCRPCRGTGRVALPTEEVLRRQRDGEQR